MTVHMCQPTKAVAALAAEGCRVIAGEPPAEALKVAMLNLMPDKRQAERQTVRLLARTRRPLHLSLFVAPGHRPRGEARAYLERYYLPWEQIRDSGVDALIVTGTPLETIPFENVRYWGGLRDVLDWSRHHVASSWFSCWGAMAALHHDHGVPKRTLARKCFGVFRQRVMPRSHPLLSGVGRTYRVPVSRSAEVPGRWVECRPGLRVLARSPVSGVGLVAERGLRRVYMLDHPEYEAHTLRDEYQRDRRAGLDTALPRGCRERDGAATPWQSTGATLLRNWLDVVRALRRASLRRAA